MDQGLISLVIVFLEIIEKPPPLSHEFQEAPAGVVILDMNLEVLREVLNALTEQSYLHLRRAGICLMESELLNHLSLLHLSNPHVFSVYLLSFLCYLLILYHTTLTL